MITAKKAFIKRVFSIILAFLMIFAYVSKSDLSFEVHAAAYWTDLNIAKTGWYDSNSSAETFTIGTAEELAGLASLVNGGNKFTGKTINLSSDINLSGKEWTPIGTSMTYYFAGTFNGNGHKISNLTVGTSDSPSTLTFVGLFGYAGISTAKATITDVTLETISIVSNVTKAKAGGLTGFICGTITGCSATGTIECRNTNAWAGGLIGQMNPAAVTDCYAKVSISASASNSTAGGGMAYTSVGGLVGWNSSDTSSPIANCYATGSLSGGNSARVGGLVGTIRYAGPSVNNCYATGDVTTGGNSPEVGYAGGLIGTSLEDTSTHAMPTIQLVYWNSDATHTVNMDIFLMQLFNGLSVSSILLLAALGLAITFGLMGVINMAHGEFIMIGAYTTVKSSVLTADRLSCFNSI